MIKLGKHSKILLLGLVILLVCSCVSNPFRSPSHLIRFPGSLSILSCQAANNNRYGLWSISWVFHVLADKVEIIFERCNRRQCFGSEKEAQKSCANC